MMNNEPTATVVISAFVNPVLYSDLPRQAERDTGDHWADRRMAVLEVGGAAAEVSVSIGGACRGGVVGAFR
jgi:hypothetical protein